MRKWRAENRDRMLKKQAEYRDAHREELCSKTRESYYENHEYNIERMRKYKKENRARVDELHSKYLKRTGRAQPKLLSAVARGEIKKEPCEICGKGDAVAHHDDYNYPLKVRWLCHKHHAEWHRFNKPIYYGES